MQVLCQPLHALASDLMGFPQQRQFHSRISRMVTSPMVSRHTTSSRPNRSLWSRFQLWATTLRSQPSWISLSKNGKSVFDSLASRFMGSVRETAQHLLLTDSLHHRQSDSHLLFQRSDQHSNTLRRHSLAGRPLSVSVLPARHGFHTEHGQCRIDLVHANGWLSLFQFTHKPQSQTGTGCRAFLRKSRSLPAFADELSDLVHGQHLLHAFR